MGSVETAVGGLDEWLTVQEVADRFNVPARAVTRIIRLGRLPAVKRGWVYLIHTSDVPASWPPKGD